MSIQSMLDAKTGELAPHFKPGFLQRGLTHFQFLFDAGEAFYLVVSGGEFRFREGVIDNPTLTLYLDGHETCWQLLDGRADGMRAFMEGRYRADGNIVLSQLLLYLFRSEDPTLPARIRD